MYEVIPRSRKNFELSGNTISSTQIKPTDIIALKQHGKIGLLGKVPGQFDRWYFKDLSKANNYWNGDEIGLMSFIDIFSSEYNHIYKFDTIQEFALWLVKELNIPIPVDQGFRFVDSKTGRFAKKPVCDTEPCGFRDIEMDEQIHNATRRSSEENARR